MIVIDDSEDEEVFVPPKNKYQYMTKNWKDHEINAAYKEAEWERLKLQSLAEQNFDWDFDARMIPRGQTRAEYISAFIGDNHRPINNKLKFRLKEINDEYNNASALRKQEKKEAAETQKMEILRTKMQIEMNRFKNNNNRPTPIPKLMVSQKFTENFCVWASWCNCFQISQAKLPLKKFEEMAVAACKWKYGSNWEYELSQEKIENGWSPTIKNLLLEFQKIPYEFAKWKTDEKKIRLMDQGLLDIITVEGNHYSHSIAVVDGYVIESLPRYVNKVLKNVYRWNGTIPYANAKVVAARIIK